MRMSTTMTIAAIMIVAAGPAAAARRAESWGKAGVAFDDYRRDAVACATGVATADVSDTESAKRYVRGFEALERENNAPPMVAGDSVIDQATRQVMLRRAYNPTRQVDNLQAELTRSVAGCLTNRGYTRFVLTRDQQRQLDRLRPGTDERRRFLHTLGSDPDVLASQRAE